VNITEKKRIEQVLTDETFRKISNLRRNLHQDLEVSACSNALKTKHDALMKQAEKEGLTLCHPVRFQKIPEDVAPKVEKIEKMHRSAILRIWGEQGKTSLQTFVEDFLKELDAI
jgi:hypothetical protein